MQQGQPPGLLIALRNLVQENPLTRLHALTQLRAAFDWLEADLVRQALQRGATWKEIGNAISLSASAANRKHKEVVPPERRRGKKVTIPRSSAGRKKVVDQVAEVWPAEVTRAGANAWARQLAQHAREEWASDPAARDAAPQWLRGLVEAFEQEESGTQ